MKIIVDSSVIVSAIRPDQVFHTASLEFLNLIRDRGDEVWVPMTMLWEIGSALSHRGKAPAGTKFNKTFDVDLRYIVIDEGLFQRTWTGNTRVPMKAADWIFVSCALDQQAPLVSWDDNLVRKASECGIVATKPSEYR
jgi:predicted nucleic acid-binding protein